MSTTPNNIYDFITEEQKRYIQPIEVEDGWDWSMKEHLRRSFLYLNSQFTDQNNNRDLRPNKNIILPIMNIQFRTEGFDVKDIDMYVNNPDEYYKSLLIKKFHQKWAREHAIDTFIDSMVVSYCVYGGVLVKKTEDVAPEVVDLRTLAFCNQTDILDYPFAIRHLFSPAELRKANKKWGDEKYGATMDVETLIALAKKENKKEIEVFEVHGLMPQDWLGSSGESEYFDDDATDVPQIQVVSFYQDQNKQSHGVILFKHREPESPFKFLSRDEVEGRAVGRGGVEELFESQIWTNWNEVKITEMLDSASRTLLWSDDKTLKSKNLRNLQNNEILSLQVGSKIQQLDTYPRNLAVFNDAMERWQDQAQRVGGGPDPLLGETPSSGTPFKLYEAQQIEAKGMHRYRQGQLAVFMDEIYKDWIMPYLGKEISKEQIFMAELSADEMQTVVDMVVKKRSNHFKKRMIIGLQDIDEGLVSQFEDQERIKVAKEGNKHFFKILKDEMKDVSVTVMTNIAGKQKNLALLTDKLVNVLRQYIATPQIRQDPEMTKLLNIILESSGLSPIMFNTAPAAQPAMAGGSTQPLQQFGDKQMANNEKI